MNIKTYEELVKLHTFRERFEYLKLDGVVGEMTFGGSRYLNQLLYSLQEWRRTRREVILRDYGCDLGLEELPIAGGIYIHHMNPITIDDLREKRPCVFDLNNLISTSFRTHNAIHYGDLSQVISIEPVVRKQNDTTPWR